MIKNFAEREGGWKGVHDQRGRPLQDLRISVIDECNFRCTYCMPAELFGNSYAFLRKDELLSFDEIEKLAKALAELGVRKIKLTGGEPLLRPWLPTLIERLVSIPGIDDVALITNGQRLAPMASRLWEAGLRRVTVSLDAIDRHRFHEISGGRGDLNAVLDGIEAARSQGFAPLKINTVVQRGVNEDQILPILERFYGDPFIVRYIEFMDVGNRNRWNMASVVSAAEIVDRITRMHPAEPMDPNYPGEVVERYRFADGAGEFGVIASVTRPFCGGCTRLRLSADGKLYTCLFSKVGIDFRELLRNGASPDDLQDRIAGLWKLREDRYAEERAESPEQAEAEAAAGSGGKVEMFYIGG